ncbi:histidine kinase [Sphaerisporangium krabiense]|uniref:histidine kinase n=1 Tax=Sphaerisporangium krabiense TaxID=763782 RepID=A0A7W8ZB66_9ACTN|nr:histidine kinase [Sphaerisporangium krabiense]MBB5630695.1 signal transduction histidine kinase [Sphaerisporangium krabiense]GII67438.1 histidine kinase [Sphaerisporangium krabiense]
MTVAEVRSPWDRIRAHWSARSWLRMFHVVTGVPLGLVAGALILGITTLSVIFVWTVAVPVAGALLLFWVVPLLTRLQRLRFEAFLDVRIPPVPRRALKGNVAMRLLRRTRSASLWRQAAYHLVSPLISVIGCAGVIVTWSGALVTGALAAQFWVLGGGWRGLPFALLCAALLVAGPWLAQGVSSLDVIAGEALLGPSISDQLAERVESLRESRAEVIDAADAERRRIERDLHDGTQQRLVSLAMKLGMARATFSDLPLPAKEMISQAHEEAKQALKELRDLVRGLHPAVLTDEGLDAALSGLAARAALPVRLRVDVPRRVASTIEAVAFFVVSEALANVAKHARATAAEVVVVREGDLLRVVVHDDGRGGADPGGGTGLRGLAQRVGSVDGTLKLDSPPGGPTTISVEMPCV